jgi:hypothetical protein
MQPIPITRSKILPQYSVVVVDSGGQLATGRSRSDWSTPGRPVLPLTNRTGHARMTSQLCGLRCRVVSAPRVLHGVLLAQGHLELYAGVGPQAVLWSISGLLYHGGRSATTSVAARPSQGLDITERRLTCWSFLADPVGAQRRLRPLGIHVPSL